MKVVLIFLTILSSALVSLGQEKQKERESIKTLIRECYIEPLYFAGDLEKIREGFHDEFRMNVLYNGEYSIRTREEWIERIKKSRENNPGNRSYAWEFDLIDVEDQTAVVKLRIKENGKLKYIDYLTLYKFEKGWKVITKQFSMY